MADDPGRSESRRVQAKGVNPRPAAIRAAREGCRLTQTEAAELVHTSCRAWQQWEAGDRNMHPAFWELFQIKCTDSATRFGKRQSLTAAYAKMQRPF